MSLQAWLRLHLMPPGPVAPLGGRPRTTPADERDAIARRQLVLEQRIDVLRQLAAEGRLLGPWREET